MFTYIYIYITHNYTYCPFFHASATGSGLDEGTQRLVAKLSSYLRLWDDFMITLDLRTLQELKNRFFAMNSLLIP